jgi:hypothetical protein
MPVELLVQPATEWRAGFLLPPTENRAAWDLKKQADAPGGKPDDNFKTLPNHLKNPISSRRLRRGKRPAEGGCSLAFNFFYCLRKGLRI